MPMGVTTESIHEMSIGGLRELNDIAHQMVTLTTMPALQQEYAELETVTASEIARREAEAIATLQISIRDSLERRRSRAEDNARIIEARRVLAEKGINISVAPELVSQARLYNLAILMEAAEAIATKNPYLTQRPSKSVKNSQLPPRKLKEEFNAATQDLDKSIAAIEKLINDKIEETREADRRARTVAIPGELKVNGAMKDFGTFLYPSAGSIEYNRARSYLLAPNRTLVHVKDELPAGASPALAGQYLAALVAGCMTFIRTENAVGDRVKINGFTPSGTSFFWIMHGKANASMPGYAGEIFHIDSGYDRSRWRDE